ncbi:MAG: conjugal transfer protein TraF [Pseudomonadota bacterium]|nr:conjugal transfer protein TraF [Pseudomonadota bacterium]
MYFRSCALLACLALGLPAASAAPFGIYDSRSQGMGGTGVVSADTAVAGFYNPALVASGESTTRYSILLPTAVARVSDQGEAIAEIDDIQDTFDRLERVSDAIDTDSVEQAVEEFADGVLASGWPIDRGALVVGAVEVLDTLLNTSTAIDTDAALAALDDLQRQLVELNHDLVELDAFVGLALARSNPKLGLSLFAGAQALANAQAFYDERDQRILRAIRKSVSLGLPPPVPPEELLRSTVNYRGAVIREIGLSVARRFDHWSGLTLGISPKAQQIQTFDYVQTVAEADIDFDQGRKVYEDVNLDIGAIKELGEHWRVGLVAKNLIAHDYKTVLGNRLHIKPQVRLGLMYQTTEFEVALDLDMVKNDPLGTLDRSTQFVSVGGELSMWDWLKLRAGYRHNMQNNASSGDVLTAGLGLRLWKFGLDASVMGGSGEYGAGLQLSFGL